MSSRVVLHAGPAVGFDEPFEMLAACHDRVRRSLDLLDRLHTHVQQHGVDAQARDAAADVLRYFDRAAPAHHEDEERHVFPRLRLAGLADLADRLQVDHLDMARLWAQLREPLQAWARGEAAGLDGKLLRNYIEMYDVHLAAEDAHAMPAAQNGLDASALSSMGAEMAARRQS